MIKKLSIAVVFTFLCFSVANAEQKICYANVSSLFKLTQPDIKVKCNDETQTMKYWMDKGYNIKQILTNEEENRKIEQYTKQMASKGIKADDAKFDPVYIILFEK